MLTTQFVFNSEVLFFSSDAARDWPINSISHSHVDSVYTPQVLAKLAAGMNKPNQQTILPTSCVQAVFKQTCFKKVYVCMCISYHELPSMVCLFFPPPSRHLGGKLGEEVQQKLHIDTVGQLVDYPITDLQRSFGVKTGSASPAFFHGKYHLW